MRLLSNQLEITSVIEYSSPPHTTEVAIVNHGETTSPNETVSTTTDAGGTNSRPVAKNEIV